MTSSNRTASPASSRELSSISVVIPTLGRDRCLYDTIRDLSKQEYPEWECLVVSQGENWGELAAGLKRVLPERLRFFHLDQPNASLARNIGLIEAKGEVVLFLDDDVVISNVNFLHNHARHFANGGISGVVGQVVGPEKTTRSRRHWLSHSKRNGWLYFPSNFDQCVNVRNGGSGNLSVRRLEASKIGSMDAWFEKAAHREESDFCLRYTDAYGLMIFDPEASLIHLGELSGGCRNWGMNAGLHPLHHVTGEWYFIMRGWKHGSIQLLDLPHHAFALLRRQIFNRLNLRSPKQVLRALRRSYDGFREASKQMREGPRYLDSVKPACYREI